MALRTSGRAGEGESGPRALGPAELRQIFDDVEVEVEADVEVDVEVESLPGGSDPPDAETAVARVFVADRDCGFGQLLQVRFERLRFVGGRLLADLVLVRGGDTHRERGCALADAHGFLTDESARRDDGGPELVHRAFVRRHAGVALLDGWLDCLLGGVEARLQDLLAERGDWLGPAAEPLRIEPVAVALRSAPEIELSAEDLRHDGALRGSLRLRRGAEVLARVGPVELVGFDGVFSPAARRGFLRALPWSLSLRRGRAVRAALDRVSARLCAVHQTVCSGAAPLEVIL